jgi:hypothetical protein
LKVFLLIIAISVFTLSGMAAFCQGSDSLRDPWTQEAATFNPVGVKHFYGMTTGQEIINHSPAVWAASAKDELLKELGR